MCVVCLYLISLERVNLSMQNLCIFVALLYQTSSLTVTHDCTPQHHNLSVFSAEAEDTALQQSDSCAQQPLGLPRIHHCDSTNKWVVNTHLITQDLSDSLGLFKCDTVANIFHDCHNGHQIGWQWCRNGSGQFPGCFLSLSYMTQPWFWFGLLCHYTAQANPPIASETHTSVAQYWSGPQNPSALALLQSSHAHAQKGCCFVLFLLCHHILAAGCITSASCIAG